MSHTLMSTDTALYICACLCLLGGAIACIAMALSSDREQSDRFDALEEEYRYRRMSEHGNADYVDTASLPHFKP
jgi:hypothetical protein